MSGAIGVLTSGGDAPGMNAAVRGVVRAAIKAGREVFLVKDGWQGLVEGRVTKGTWSSVSHTMQRGGTALGTARSDAFRTPQGRAKAAQELAQRGITALAVVGGDGSLTGASLLADEWATLQPGQPPLRIVGIIGSIDNDVVGFSATLGADTALHTICGALDSLASTALAHHRTFVVECMGRDCGWLTLAAGVVCAADYVLIPERPPARDAWAQQLRDAVQSAREQRSHALVLISEGARDDHGTRLTAATVVAALQDSDARTTTLGHVQRGAAPTAYDRFQGTVLGVRAVEALLSNVWTGHVIVGLRGYTVAALPLAEAVQRTRQVNAMLRDRQFVSAFDGRGTAFAELWSLYERCSGPAPAAPSPAAPRRVALCTVGAPAPGMNFCVRALSKLLQRDGFHVLLGRDGFEGIALGQLRAADWHTCDDWAPQGGALLGSGRGVPKAAEMARELERAAVTALVIVGGFEAYVGADQLRLAMPALSVIVIPATISLNVPGTHASIGMDKASNNLVQACDNIKQATVGYTKRVHVVESIGRSCGFQTLFGAICVGAEHCVLPEAPPSLGDTANTVRAMKARLAGSGDAQIGLIVQCEGASSQLTPAVLAAMHEAEGVSARVAQLAGLQQGGHPTPLDRVCAGRLALLASQLLRSGSGCLQAGVGIVDDQLCVAPLAQLMQRVDARLRRPLEQPWLSLQAVLDTVAMQQQPQPHANL